MKKVTVFSVICFICLAACAGTVLAEKGEKETGLLTLPWDEFKQFLALGKEQKDDIVVPMETFRKLLVCSGIDIKPEHTLIHGNVVLTKDEFNTLIKGLKPPVKDEVKPLPENPEDPLPFDYLATRAVYEGNVENNAVSFTGTFHFHVLKKDGPLNIPLLPQTMALDDIRLNGEPALVILENGYHHVVVTTPGDFVATVVFSVKPVMDKGTHRINMTIQQTPITLLTLGLPSNDMAVSIPQAQMFRQTTDENSTRISASITPGRAMTIHWRKKDATAEKIPAKVYSDVRNLVSIDDDALKINSEISYRIFHSEIHGVRVQIPRNINVLNVTGEAVGEWRETMDKDSRVLFVPFTYGKKGTAVMNVFCEQRLSENSITNTFEGLQTLGTVGETGYIGMELKTSAEVNITRNAGLERIAAQKLPPSLYTKSERPLMYAFKYTKHPFTLSFDTKKHRKVAVPVAVVNSANILTLFTEDGKVVHQLLYQVKNSAKQFMKVTLPDNADVWSVFVDEKPVESSLNAEGKLLVPLIRSRSNNTALAPFPVEVIYCLSGETLSSSGSLESHMPSVDILISRLMWSVYLPDDYAYHYFQSTLEKEEMIRGVNVFGGSRRRYDGKAIRDVYDSSENKAPVIQEEKLGRVYQGKDYASRFKNLPMDKKQMASQVQAELNFSGRLSDLEKHQRIVSGVSSGTGIMPIQIDIPTGGQVYRFAKTLIRSDDPLDIRIMYSSKRVTSLAKWLLFGLVMGLAVLMRRPFTKILNGFSKTLKNHEGTFKAVARSKMTPLVLFVLALFSRSLPGDLSLWVLFLCFVNTVYLVVHGRKKKKQKNILTEDAQGSMPV